MTEAPSADSMTLLASLESAERGDRKLDWLIHSTIAEPWNEGRKWSPFGYVDVDGHPPHPDEICIESPEGKSHYNHMPRYTDSVDAALALAERVLPGWHKTIAESRAYWVAEMGPLDWSDDPMVAPPDNTLAEAKTPALALCACLLRATQSRSTPEDGKGG